jgi:hypothetical protein
MENGANTTPYPMNIINLAPLGSAQKKQKEHKENKHESKQKNKTNIEEKKEESIKVSEEIDSDNDIPVEINVERDDKEEKEEKGIIRVTPKKENQIENEKAKRHRRTKDEITERQHQCPDCDKCYLSAPALMTHRKTKHGYEFNNDKKIRGRPRKDLASENPTIVSQNKYNSFFKNDTRKPPSLDQTINDKTITLDIIQQFITDAFRHCQTEHTIKYENIEQYPIYKLVIDNWNKETPDLEQESYLDESRTKNKSDPLKKIKSPCVDNLFYLYLREFSKKTNKDYFWFMVKFVVLFRESINVQKKDMVTDDIITENKTEFTQLFNGEEISELCNDFFLDFMEPNKFFGLNKEELIELIQHFCFWLYTNMYSSSHLTLYKN